MCVRKTPGNKNTSPRLPQRTRHRQPRGYGANSGLPAPRRPLARRGCCPHRSHPKSRPPRRSGAPAAPPAAGSSRTELPETAPGAELIPATAGVAPTGAPLSPTGGSAQPPPYRCARRSPSAAWLRPRGGSARLGTTRVGTRRDGTGQDSNSALAGTAARFEGAGRRRPDAPPPISGPQRSAPA